MKKEIGFLSLLATGILAFAVANAQAETLRDTLQHVLETNPSIRTVYHNHLGREQEVLQAKSGYYPKFDISTEFGHSKVYEPSSSSTHPTKHILSLRQNLFTGLATENEVKRQEARVRSAQFKLQGVSESVALQTVRAYLDVLLHKELHELAQENLTIHERILDQMKLRAESGVDHKANLDHVKGRVALAESNIVVTAINKLDASTSFQAVVGYKPENLVKPQIIDSGLPGSAEEAREQAVNNHPTLKSAEADLEARDYQYKVAKSPFLPVLDVEVDRSWEHDADDFVGDKEELLAVIRLRYNLFHGGLDTARRAETLQLKSEAYEIRNQTYRQVEESVRLSWMALKAAQDKLKLLKEYVAATAATAEAFSKQWSIGKRTMLDVLDTEAEVINAKKDLITAEYDSLYAQYRILSGMGALVHSQDLAWPGEAKDEDQPATEPAAEGEESSST